MCEFRVLWSRLPNAQPSAHAPTPELAIHAESTVVKSQTSLSDLLETNMGMCHWVAPSGSSVMDDSG
jgi:hypothetical protein